MAIQVVRLGSPRTSGEGLRLGTVRRPPRGVRKEELAARDFYDVWLPELAPSEELLKSAQAAAAVAASGEGDRAWKAFVRRYRAEMKEPERARALDLLAALSRQTDFSVGCYCADEAHCHRSILRELLGEHGAAMVEE
jgi:uncharacterized protein YeaO (DUF488 family)